MPRAESVSIDGEVLAFLLFLLLAVVAVWLLAVVLGFRWAIRAGAGSRRASVLWAVSGVVVAAPGLLAGPNPLLLGALLILGAQAACFFAMRGRAGNTPGAARGGPAGGVAGGPDTGSGGWGGTDPGSGGWGGPDPGSGGWGGTDPGSGGWGRPDADSGGSDRR